MAVSVKYQSSVNWGSGLAMRYRLKSTPAASPSLVYLKRDATNLEYYDGPYDTSGNVVSVSLVGEYLFTLALVSGSGTGGDPWVAGATISAGILRDVIDGAELWINDAASFAKQSNIESVVNSLSSSALGNVVASLVELNVDGFPTTLFKKDARTDENGGAIAVRVYDVEDTEYTTPLLGVGSLLFTDADEIWLAFSLRDATTPEVEFQIEWIEVGTSGDGYFKIEYDEDALDDATSFVAGSQDYHRWGIKCVWPTVGDPRTVAHGTTKIINRIVAAGV